MSSDEYEDIVKNPERRTIKRKHRTRGKHPAMTFRQIKVIPQSQKAEQEFGHISKLFKVEPKAHTATGPADPADPETTEFAGAFGPEPPPAHYNAVRHHHSRPSRYASAGLSIFAGPDPRDRVLSETFAAKDKGKVDAA